MSLIEKVIEFVTKKLSIEINEENQKLILDEFYPDIEAKNYWSFLEYRLYEGIITKDEYERKKALPQDTYICFGSVVKYVDDECELNEIRFSDDRLAAAMLALRWLWNLRLDSCGPLE